MTQKHRAATTLHPPDSAEEACARYSAQNAVSDERAGHDLVSYGWSLYNLFHRGELVFALHPRRLFWPRRVRMRKGTGMTPVAENWRCPRCRRNGALFPYSDDRSYGNACRFDGCGYVHTETRVRK